MLCLWRDIATRSVPQNDLQLVQRICGAGYRPMTGNVCRSLSRLHRHKTLFTMLWFLNLRVTMIASDTSRGPLRILGRFIHIHVSTMFTQRHDCIDIDIPQVIEEFARCHSRRIELLNILAGD